MAERRTTPRRRQAGEKTERGVIVVSVLVFGAMLAISVLLARNAPAALADRAVAIGLTAYVVFGAAVAVGALLGFLFGLPRARLTDQSGATPPADAGQPAPAGLRYLSNSNLIKVSDWLTTIVVGLGLVNLPGALPALGRLANALSAPLGGPDYAGAIGLPLVISGFLAGFVLCYLWTSVRLRELFQESEEELETVPDLQDQPLGEARATLRTTGTLRLTPPDGATDDAPIASQGIRPDTLVPAGTSIAVSTKVKVPDVTTRTFTDATQLLHDAGLTANGDHADPHEPVTGQEPPADTWANPDTPVTVTTR